jgi:NhaA family Na+:H+ antiporter
MRHMKSIFRAEAFPGVLLLACAIIALTWSNSPWGEAYHHLWDLSPASIGIPSTFSLELFINDALMAIFFLLVGLEIKREIVSGELASFQHAALPVAGALGGMLLPAAIFMVLNAGRPGESGWGIPMATDIAFALGVLALLGKRVPPGLKVFLVALAILDDLGAILVIALFYSNSLNGFALLFAAAIVVSMAIINHSGVRHPAPYLIRGIILWFVVLKSGIHPTIAGVVTAFCIPHTKENGSPSLLERSEAKLHFPVIFIILPLFALANAGVALSPSVRHTLFEPLGLGIILGLCLGKPIGILLFSWGAVRLRLASIPTGVTFKHLTGAGLLGGIGFTMSIFIAHLGLPSLALLDGAKFAVLVASLLSGIAGYFWLRTLKLNEFGHS